VKAAIYNPRERLTGGSRMPPHNREAERALIGTMLRDPRSIAEVLRLVRVEDYYVHAHCKIHEVIIELHGGGVPLDTVTLAEALTNRALMDDVGGHAYIADLWDAAPSSTNCRHYAEIVTQYAKRRRIARLAAEMEDRAYDLGENPELTLNSAVTQLCDIRDGASPQDIENLTLPGQTWPVLDNAAYYGIIGDIVAHLEPETEADPVGILVQLLIAVGNAIGRTAHSRVEGDRHYCNLFGVGVGKSGHGRKGTSWGRVRQMMTVADPGWVEKCTGSGMSSGEGLIQRVRDSFIIENGDSQTLVPGVTDKRLLAMETEFGGVLKVLKRDGNTLSAIIRNAWDSGNISTMTKSPVKTSNAHISILGHITVQELHQCFDQVDVFNGFANRFLWFLVKRSKLLPEGGRLFDLGPLTKRLTEVIEGARRLEELGRQDLMRELWSESYPKLTAARSGLAGIVTSRAEGQVLRIATLYAALDCSPFIMLVHLQAALALWAYCEESARQIFGCEERLDRLTQAILERLQAAGDRGLSRTQISYAIGRHHSSQRIMESLAHLRDVGKARFEERSTTGRPVEWWFSK